MRRFKLVGIVALAGIVGVTLFLGMPLLGSNAGVSHADGQGAAVIKDNACWISSGASGLPCNLTTDESHTVVTKSGNVILICKFDIPEDCRPAKAIKNTGFGCGIATNGGSVSTTNSMSIASPGGKATLRCEYKP